MASPVGDVRSIRVIDSHTGGEPTRVVVDGGPELGQGTMAARLEVFRTKYDAYRSAIVNEPRGSDVLVGAMMVRPVDPTCVTGVIFFNNVGFLGMCGHGTIGLVVTLAYLGRIGEGEHRLETPVGVVSAKLGPGGAVSVTNVASYRKVRAVTVEVPGIGRVTGDVAWGGNWFFLVAAPNCSIELPNKEELTNFAWRLRRAVNDQGYPEVDHVELFGPSRSGGDSQNFVLCPGKAYDRSACGTGTSAKLACLAADNKLAEGETWVQESILGSKLEGSYRWIDRTAGVIGPLITGVAHITAETNLRLDPNDPFCWGIPNV